VILITSASEFEQVYGQPQTPAERFFYYTCNQVINSPGTLLTTRLPYGSGAGAGFGSQYSATVFPITSGTGSFTIKEPSHVVLTEAQYSQLLQGNITWKTTLSAGQPVYTKGSLTGSSTLTADNVGLIVVNSSKTSINEGFEGYYVSVIDNTNFGPESNFDSILWMKSLTSDGSDFYTVPSTRLDFALSSTAAEAGYGSISEIIEGIPLYNFGDDYYKDSVILNVFKIRNSIYDPQTLSVSLVESHIGSLDANKKIVAPMGGVQKTFFLETLINNDSANLRALVNPQISTRTNWSQVSSVNPGVTVTVDTSAKALFANGVYHPTFNSAADKNVGELVTKIDRALTLIESPDDVVVDVVVDGGLSTVFAVASASVYDDTTFVSGIENTNSSEITRAKTVHEKFNNFVTNVRRDCMFIADPLRNIFVNGADTKTMDVKSNTFSNNIYKPLKALFGSLDSSYTATYATWIKTYDQFEDRYVWVPPSGFAAAAFARTDSVAQPWFAPAGLSRGNLYGVSDLAFNPNQKQRDFLYTISINPIVYFSQDGNVIMGQKTSQTKPTAFDRINVRRLFLTLERAVQGTIKYFLFEPNTEFTRTRVKNTISPIFDMAKNTEGLYDYLIICDERNNTPDVIDRNELIVDIYIKSVRAAEFINVNFVATRTGQNFQELI